MDDLCDYLYDLEFCYKIDTSTRMFDDVSNLILPSYITNWCENMKIIGYVYHEHFLGDYGEDGHNF